MIFFLNIIIINQEKAVVPTFCISSHPIKIQLNIQFN